MTTIDHLPDDILKEIFEETPHHTMIIRTVCRRWRGLVKIFRTTSAALQWRNVNSMSVPDKPTFVELSLKHGLKNNVQHYCETESKLLCKCAAKGGHLEVLKWARVNGCPWDEWTCAYAAEGGQLEVLKWARVNGCSWNEWTCVRAAKSGYFEVLEWARANGCPWDEWTCAYAANGGHLEILKWARANGCPWDKWTCTHVANGGQLEVLKWARANGCPWDKWTCVGAAENGQLEVLKWARANGCPWDYQLVYDSAARCDQQSILEWLTTHNQ